MERIPLAHGRWVRFARCMYISDRRAMAAVSDLPPETTYLELFDRIISAIEPAIAERSWEGPFDQITPDELQDIARAWTEQTESNVLPPADGTDSATTPQPGS